MNPLARAKLAELLKEDLPFGDVTSELLVDESAEATAEITAKDEGIVSGIEAILEACSELGLRYELKKRSGDLFSAGDRMCRLSGNARTLLGLERTILNLLGKLSGIATATWNATQAVREVNDTTRIAGTRKTTPGLRELEKEALRHGGGDTHRFSLSDMILIKDNHIALAGGVREALTKALGGKSFAHKVEIEVTSMDDVLTAAKLGADIIMCDNMAPEQVGEVVGMLRDRGLRDRVLLEVSGGITLENAPDYARAGADILSMGALTHSVRAVDFSMNIVKGT
jgi:nicotinate-nucleotide pyrophosphorylase (carboxylating)